MASPSIGNMSKYPWGLSIRLGTDELEKLGAKYDDFEVGGVYHIHALVKVTSVSCNDTEDGKTCGVELQITHLASMESEDAEDEDNKSDAPSLKKHGYVRQK